MRNVYHIERGISKLTDGRVNPTYETATVITIVLLGFLLRIKSFNELNYLIKSNEFIKLFPRGTKLPQIDTIRDTLKVIGTEELKQIIEYIVKKAIENKVFKNGTIDGYNVAAMDGTKFFGSNKKSCFECLINDNHSFHSGVVLSTIGDGPKLVIGFEMYKPALDPASKNEGEQNAAKRLLSSAFNTHKNFIDVLVYDSLVCNSVWINRCIALGVEVVVRAKNNNNSSIRKVKSKVNKQDSIETWTDEKGFEEVEVYESAFTMGNVLQPLRFVKFAMKRPNNKRSQIMIVTTCMDMGLKTLFKIIRARWYIENSIFNNLKKECGLEHCFVHGGKAVEAVLCLIFIASNLMQLFFYRRLKKIIPTQRELIRLLIKGLYFLKYDRKLIFNTT